MEQDEQTYKAAATPLRCKQRRLQQGDSRSPTKYRQWSRQDDNKGEMPTDPPKPPSASSRKHARQEPD